MINKLNITVVIPLYNKTNGILNAIDSIMKQTVEVSEIVIVNDGSTDDSIEKVNSLINNKIKIYEQINQGVSAARNKGIEIAKGDWIAFLDADDQWNPNYIETINDLYISFPSCSVLATSYELQDINGNRKKNKINNIRFREKGILENYFEVASTSNPPLWTSAIVVKKSSILAVNKFPVGIKLGEDLITWAKLASKFSIAYSLDTMGIYFLDSSQSFLEKPPRVPEKEDYVGTELIKLYRLNKEQKHLKKYISHWFKMRASIFLRIGDNSNAFNEILKALKYNIYNTKLYVYALLILLPLKYRNSFFKKLASN